ncbi:hypothetical protein [Bradyrhizobium centrolobii]|uniref:hypothetical protein n=1 Tax=Bradyrhizobium centrolobii TaxID=1505087 RepID=UPI0010A971EC|nr:hypothetical protein [Bradyrhizobium centrolobii]
MFEPIDEKVEVFLRSQSPQQPKEIFNRRLRQLAFARSSKGNRTLELTFIQVFDRSLDLSSLIAASWSPHLPPFAPQQKA